MAKPKICLPPASWPAADRTQWQLALRSKDLFTSSSVALHWRPATVAWVAKGYGYALYWLAQNGVLDPDRPAAARWTVEVLRGYLASLRARSLSPVTIRNQLTALERALAVIAPKADRSPLQTAIGQFAVTGDQQHKRVRLQDPSDLAQLGHQLMAEAEMGLRPHPRMDAALFRDGLQIALLALRPMRRKNFAALRIGKQLVQGAAGWWLVVGRDETKTKQPIEVQVPTSLVPALNRYLTVYRPLLAGTRYSGDALWMSYHFTEQSAHSIQLRIVEQTQRAFGKPINPHLFRDCAATSIAIHDPENVLMASMILGHRTLAMTEKHYNLARSLDAGKSYHEAIDHLRKAKLIASRT